MGVSKQRTEGATRRQTGKNFPDFSLTASMTMSQGLGGGTRKSRDDKKSLRRGSGIGQGGGALAEVDKLRVFFSLNNHLLFNLIILFKDFD